MRRHRVWRSGRATVSFETHRQERIDREKFAVLVRACTESEEMDRLRAEMGAPRAPRDVRH